jgi:ribosomal protein S18 acetylase RimI-like enzyme
MITPEAGSSLEEKREAIRPLLDSHWPADAMATYYAFYHPSDRVRLVIYPAESRLASGYVALARTGIDLFRPFVTLRLPPLDMEGSVNLLYSALPAGSAVILTGPVEYRPLLTALFEVQKEDVLRLYAMHEASLEPEINVLVTAGSGPGGSPRRVIVQPDEGVVASAGLNWQSPHFAEIAVNTAPHYRRRGWGRAVVVGLAQEVLAGGRTPLYVVTDDNQASIALAESAGFTDTGAREVMLEGILRPRP